MAGRGGTYIPGLMGSVASGRGGGRGGRSNLGMGSMPGSGAAMQGRASATPASAAGAGAGRGLPPDFSEADYSVGLRSMQTVCSGLTAAKVVQLESGVVKRPGVGFLGRPINVLTNHFRIAFKIDKVLVYEVKVTRSNTQDRRRSSSEAESAGSGAPAPAAPAPLPVQLCKEVIAALSQQQGWPAVWLYDGRSSLYAVRAVLPTDPTELTVSLEAPASSARPQQQGDPAGPPATSPPSYTVTSKVQAVLDVRAALLEYAAASGGRALPVQALRVLDLAFRHGLGQRPGAVQCGRATFFLDSEAAQGVTPGLELLSGFRQSINACQAGLTLALDLAARPFVAPARLLTVVALLLRAASPAELAEQQLSQEQLQLLSKALPGLRIAALHHGRALRYQVRSLSLAPAASLPALSGDLGSVSVAQHFQQRYGPLAYPLLPCVNVSPGTQPVWLPLELCNLLPGQPAPPGLLHALEEAHGVSSGAGSASPTGVALLPPSMAVSQQRSSGGGGGSGSHTPVAGQSPTAVMAAAAAAAAAAGLAMSVGRPHLVGPEARCKDIVDLAKGKAQLLGDPTINNFQLQMADGLLQVPARVLPSPFLEYASPRCMDVGTLGVWNLRDAQLLRGSKISSWAALSLVPRAAADVEGPGGVAALLADLQWVMASLGVQVAQPPAIVYADDPLPSSNGSSHAAAANGHAHKQEAEVGHGTADTPHNDQQEGSREQQQQQHGTAEPSSNGSAAAGGSNPASSCSGGGGGSVPPSAVLALMQRAYKVAEERCGAPPQLLLVLLPDTSPARYKAVKAASDSVLGVPSQCLVARHAGVGPGALVRGRLQYCLNVSFKVNAKLGGTNVKLLGEPRTWMPLMRGKPFMVVGAAVGEAAPGAGRGGPRVAAVVGSIDKFCARYATQLTSQEEAHTLPSLAASMRELIDRFAAANGGCRPERLLLYRLLGSSRAGAGGALQQEVEAVRQACKAISDESGQDYAPAITFVAVSKGHPTRLFPLPGDAANLDRLANVLPGSVVDKQVVGCHEHDFLLVSSASVQGTSRPGHFQVVADDIGFGADALQVASYWLSYLNCRSTRSIGLPVPLHYARLAAARGQCFMSHSAAAGQGASAATTTTSPSPCSSFSGLHQQLASTMFFA